MKFLYDSDTEFILYVLIMGNLYFISGMKERTHL